MSPDNYKFHSKLIQMVKAFEKFSEVYPSLAEATQRRPEDFAGLSVWLGDSGNLVAALRRFGSDGAPEVLYSEGVDFMDLLYNLDKRSAGDNWRPDKKKLSGKAGSDGKAKGGEK